MRVVCGILHLNGANASEELLRNMAAQMDVPQLRPSLRLWRDGPVGFALYDSSAHEAPALAETAASIIAADVRLDEPIALARMLGCDPQPEDALLLAALDRLGLSSLDRVLGDFAFARWDASAQRLVCGRDIFGIRPLAYVHQPGQFFAFASFPKALYGAGIVSKEVDEDALARRMVRKMRLDESLIAGIKRLPPAHVVEVSCEGISLKCYWQLDRAAAGTRRCSPEAAARELRRLVEEAVACRLPRHGEIGAHLSGGLDSSTLAVLAARRLREQGRVLHAYSFLDRQRNDITLEDETEFVKAVVEQEGDIDWTPIRPPAGMPASYGPMDADKMMQLDPDEPENSVCRRAEARGVHLVLSGWGGDEGATFNGRGTLAELFLRGRWRTLAREVAALKLERSWPALQIFRGEVLSCLLPQPVKVLAGRIIGRKETDPLTLVGRVLSAAVRQRLAASGDEDLDLTPDGRENRWRLLTSPHIAERAEVWAQIGARHGLAFAFPLLDRRVVEFALSLPSEFFLRGGFRRRLFRDAMVDVLPPSVRLRHRKYHPFPSHWIDVAENKDELLARVAGYQKNANVRRLIDLARLRRQVETFPSPESVRDEIRGGGTPAAAVAMIAATQALRAAEYLEQHGGEQAAPTTRCEGD
jgi:asparagine synthase (glutamine-hydrolysing)